MFCPVNGIKDECDLTTQVTFVFDTVNGQIILVGVGQLMFLSTLGHC